MHPSPAQFERFRASRQLPGLVLSVFSADSVETLALGRAETASLFPVASITKTFTADMVLELAGASPPDRPVREVLPDFALADPEASALLTVRDALCHFSGLPPHTWSWVYGDVSRAEFIRERLPRLDSAGPFRQQHRYSNILYAVLGEWIEAVGGQSWERRMQQVISGPPHLENTRLLDENWASFALPPHKWGEGGLQECPRFFAKKHHLIAPAGELMASVPDLAKWGQYHLRLSPEDIRWRPHNRITTQRPHPAMGPLHYGLGWRVDTVCGEPRVWHSGQCSGYSSLLVIYPARKTGFAAAANLHASVPHLQELDLWIHHSVLPDFPEVGSRKPEAGDRREEAGENTTRPRGRPTTSLISGHYRHPGYGDLELFLKDGWLHSRFQGSPPVPLLEEEGIVRLFLPGYSVSFPVTQPAPGTLSVPFEPECENVVFTDRSTTPAGRAG